MRDAFAGELLNLATASDRVVLLTGDLGFHLFDSFTERFPHRFINAGVAEQGMLNAALGMAMSGLRPVVYSIAPFVTARVFEQIKMICYHDTPVVIVGVGAGLSYSDLGPTHHAMDDIAIMRTLPGMQVCCPGDPWEVRAALRCALASDHPTYLRLGKRGEPCVHAGIPAEFSIGKAIDIAAWDDGRVCILACGTVLPVAIEAGRLLAERGVCTPHVASIPWVKPLDERKLGSSFLGLFDLVVTVEEHGLVGGFGSAVAEWASDHILGQCLDCDIPALLRIGSPDSFHCMAGDQNAAREALGLTAEHIAARIKEQLS